MLSEVKAAIRDRPTDTTLLLLCDFDGTLAEFDPNPAAPVLSAARRARLEAIARQPHTAVGIVSGRRLDDLRHRTFLPPTIYHAGLHGLEIDIDDRRWEHPDLGRGPEMIGGLATALSRIVGRCPGALLEDKGVSVAFHARRTPRDRREEVLTLADSVALPWIADGRVRRLEGDAVVEYLPNIAGHKGEATRWIVADVEARERRAAWVVYIGDDITDEDAFCAIPSGIAVLVGLRPTSATHKLNGIPEVDLFLSSLTTAE